MKLLESLLCLVSFIAVTGVAKADIPTVDCDVKTVANFCEKLKSKEKTQLRSRIPHKFSNGESMPSADSISGNTLETYEDGRPNIPWGKMQRLQKLYAQTQKYAQEAVLQGRSYDEISQEEKNLIERIKTMKLSNLQSSEDQEICRSNWGYGYSPRTHTLIMCPEMAGYPSSAIVWSMAAFVGRGLGTCATGVLKWTDSKKKVVFDTIPKEKYPLQNLRSCLLREGYPDSPGGIDFEKPELKNILNAEIGRAHQSRSNDLPQRSEKLTDALKNEENLKWAKGLINEHRECLPEQTNARVDSGIQDWFGSEVTARFLEDHPLNAQTPEDNLQPLAAMVDFTCRSPKAEELTQKFHVPIETRLNSAIFSNERLRRAMNCSPKVPAKGICSSGPPLESQRSGGSRHGSGAPAKTAK
jgi:hypothetical protein